MKKLETSAQGAEFSEADQHGLGPTTPSLSSKCASISFKKRKLELPQPPLPSGKHPQKDERKELPNACVVHYKTGLYSDDEARNAFV